MGAPTRADAAALDAADALAAVRDQFVMADESLAYMDGNSLGRLPRRTAARLQRLVQDEWGGDLVRGWDRWVDAPLRVGEQLGTGLLGAEPGETVVADSTTVNLYKLAAAALAARPEARAVVTDADNFPTDRYVLQGLAATYGLEVRLVHGHPVDGPSAADVGEAVAPGDVALVLLSAVAYRSGAVADVAAITAVAHAGGALALWDLSHSVGAVPLDLRAAGADMATGCTYKYLCGGPGAPAFLWVRRELQGELRQPIWGWFGQRHQFAMGPDHDPVDGMGAYCSGTPPVLALVGVQAGVELVLEAGIDRLRAKSLALTDLVVSLADEWLAPLGCGLATPRPHAHRGGHVSVTHPDARRIAQCLRERFAVVPDFRAPDVVRLGPAPLTTRFTEVWDALDRLRHVVATRAYDDVPEAVAAARVT